MSGRRQNARTLTSRLGPGDESARSDFASDGETDHVVAPGGDHRDVGPEFAAHTAPVRTVRLGRTVRLAAGKPRPKRVLQDFPHDLSAGSNRLQKGAIGVSKRKPSVPLVGPNVVAA
jgi:hypothetical protein